MSPLARRILVTILLWLHLLVDLAAIPLFYWLKIEDSTGFAIGFLFGTMLGQIALLAMYLAWGRDHWFARCFKSFAVLVLLWFAITAGAVSTGDSFEVSSLEQLLAMLVGLSFAFIPLPFLLLRWICGSRFATVAGDQPAAGSTKPQFGIRDLLIWTTAAAILLAILSSPIGRELWDPWSLSWQNLLSLSRWMLLWSAFATFVALPAAWACLGEHPPAERLRGLLFLLALITTVESIALSVLLRDNSPLLVLVGLNVAICGAVVGSLLLLRRYGYRLHLRPPPLESPLEPPEE